MAKDLLELLTAGGYGLAAIEGVVIVYLWKDNKVLREQVREVAVSSIVAMKDLAHAIRERDRS